MSRKQFVCAANLGFPIQPCGFIHFFPFFWFVIWQSASHFFYTPWTLLLLKDQGVALGHSAMHVENSLRHHMRSISIVEAGIWSAQGVTFWMMDRRAVYWWPLHDRICPQPCFRNWRWSQSTTVWSQGISEMKFISTLSNSLWKNYLDYLDCIDHL